MSTLRPNLRLLWFGPGSDLRCRGGAPVRQLLAEQRIGLVYGGGATGSWATSVAVLDHGGHVTGIIPEFLSNASTP